MTPCLGSIRPPSLGRPPSVVSGYLIPPSVTDIRFWGEIHHIYKFMLQQSAVDHLPTVLEYNYLYTFVSYKYLTFINIRDRIVMSINHEITSNNGYKKC